MGTTVHRRLRLLMLAIAVALAGAAAWALAGGRGDASAADPGGGPPRMDVTAPFRGGHEIPSLRTANSRTYVAPNGMHVARVSAGPVNFKDADGNWQPIDPRLEREGSSWVNRANAFQIQIPTSLGDGPVRVARHGRWIAMRLRGDDVPATVDGSSATFSGVADGVTARWTSQAQQLKEDLVLADAGAPASYLFDVSLSDGLLLRDAADGSVEAVGPHGGVAFTLAAPFAVDASGDRAPDGAVTMRAQRDGADWVVRVAVAPRWLRADDRAFPVTIDPSVYAYPVGDCTIDQETPTTANCSSTTLTVGHENGTTLHDHRALLWFDVANAVPSAANVLSATLWAHASAKSGTSTSPIDAYRVTRDWSADVTWNNADRATSWTSAGGDVAASPEDTSAAPVVNDWTGWNVTDLVREWLDGSYPDYGVLLKDQGSASVNATRFDSNEVLGGSTRPGIDITYFPRTGRQDDYTFDTQALSDRQTLSVNPAGGNMLLSSRDLEIRGTGLDLSLERAFNSTDDWTGALGFGNRLSVGTDVTLLECDSTESMCFYGPSGTHVRFKKLADGSFEAPPGANARLVRNRDGSYALTFLRSGLVYRFFSGQNTFVTDIVDPNGNTLHFDYTSSRLSQIVDSQGRRIAVSRNGSGDITQIQDPSGRAWRYGYSLTGRKLTSVTDPEGNVTQYQFDRSDNIDLITDARGNAIHVAYDGSDRVTSVTRTVDGGSNDVVTSFAYSSASSPCGARGDVGKTVVTNPRSKTTTYCWNALGQVTSTFDALGRKTTQSFTSNLDHNQMTDYADTANPATTDLDYNANNDLTRAAQPSGEQQTVSYWSAASNTNDPLRDHRVQSTTDANGVDQYFDYDNAGNLTSVKDDTTTPRNQATLTYNGNGTLASFTDGESHRTSFSYDASGNLREVTPPSVSSPGTLGTTQYTYDSLSRVDTVTDGRGETLTYSYDGLDRITRVEAEDGSWIAYTYDANGNLATREDSGGSRTSYTYDKLNRQTEEDLPGAAYNQYGYDKNGNVTSIIDQSGTVTYGYDDVDRVTSTVSPKPGGGTDTVTYSYTDPDARSAVTVRTATLPGSTTQRVERDLSGKITDVLLKDRSSATLQERSYSYLNGSTQTDLVQTMLDEAGNRTTYTYADRTENSGRLLKARTEDGSSALVTEYRYAYDKAGNRLTREVETGRGTTTTTYAYNAANQLCWRYVGTSSNDCATAPGGATTFTYDAAGQQLTGDNTLTWDRYGRLASVDRTSLGFLSRTNDALSAFGSTALQDNALGFSRSDDGRTVTSIVRDPNTNAVVSQNDGTNKRWYTGDNVGSTIGLTDDTGALVRTYGYDPDGTSTTSGSGPVALAGFAGGQSVGSSGLYHFGARFYDPRTGRWTSIDPLRHDSDLTQANLYGYVGQNPMNLVDPTGAGLFRWIEKIAVKVGLRGGGGVMYAACYGWTISKKGVNVHNAILTGVQCSPIGFFF
ncbi:MAG: DNRLRE domain-containing protein [Actinobacteria bacterium]|nr:DNRLRE domain-containing protein [Actinomycetota bacterium]